MAKKSCLPRGQVIHFFSTCLVGRYSSAKLTRWQLWNGMRPTDLVFIWFTEDLTFWELLISRRFHIKNDFQLFLKSVLIWWQSASTGWWLPLLAEAFAHQFSMAHICPVLFIIHSNPEGIWVWDPWHSLLPSTHTFACPLCHPCYLRSSLNEPGLHVPL